jgi:DNA-binding transcriptional LysR family regulator
VLRVSCPIMIADAYVSDAVVSFIERHPAVSVELSVSNSMTDLVDDRIDLAIRGAPRLESSSLVARRLATMAKAICASPAYVEKHGTPRSPDDLRGHRCLHFSLRRAALAGLGIVALPRFYLAGDLARGDLVELLPGFSLEPLGLFAVHAKGKLVPAKIRGFVEHMVRRLRAAKLD